jgi:hypothetical protein
MIGCPIAKHITEPYTQHFDFSVAALCNCRARQTDFMMADAEPNNYSNNQIEGSISDK